MANLRFCAYQYQHLPLEELRDRWRVVEDLGFDVLWNCDTVVEPDRRLHTMFDGPATLTMMAEATSRIRVGTLVTSLYFRHPVTLTKAAMTVDHLSGGRVEVALGVGDPSAGARAAGVDWSAGERVSRFREFVELVDLLLRHEVTDYDGRFYRCEGAETIPLPVQRPRPPLTIAAHGPKMLRIAAEIRPYVELMGWLRRRDRGGLLRPSPLNAVIASTTCALMPGAIRAPFGIRWSSFPPLTPWQVGGVLPRHGLTIRRDRY